MSSLTVYNRLGQCPQYPKKGANDDELMDIFREFLPDEIIRIILGMNLRIYNYEVELYNLWRQSLPKLPEAKFEIIALNCHVNQLTKLPELPELPKLTNFLHDLKYKLQNIKKIRKWQNRQEQIQLKIQMNYPKNQRNNYRKMYLHR